MEPKKTNCPEKSVMDLMAFRYAIRKKGSEITSVDEIRESIVK